MKQNFPNAYVNNDMLCDLCNLFPCTQEHHLQCPVFAGSLVVDKGGKLTEKFNSWSTNEQLVYVKIYKHFLDLRDKLLKQKVMYIEGLNVPLKGPRYP